MSATRVSKVAAIAVFGAAGWKGAESWPIDKMSAKLKDVPDCMDDDYVPSGDSADLIKEALGAIEAAVIDAGGEDPTFEVFEEAAAEAPAEDKKEEAPAEDKKEEKSEKAKAKAAEKAEKEKAKAEKAEAKKQQEAEKDARKAEREKAKAEAVANRTISWQAACARVLRDSEDGLNSDIKDLSARVVALRKDGNEKTALWALRTMITAVQAWESTAS